MTVFCIIQSHSFLFLYIVIIVIIVQCFILVDTLDVCLLSIFISKTLICDNTVHYNTAW